MMKSMKIQASLRDTENPQICDHWLCRAQAAQNDDQRFSSE